MGRVGVRMWRSSGREASVAGAADAVLVLLKAGATIDTKAPSASGFALDPYSFADRPSHHGLPSHLTPPRPAGLLAP